MNLQQYKVSPEQLRWRCDCSAFPFGTTADIPPLKGLVEQERPIRAIRFGLGIASPGYNIYVSGLTGTGKTTVIKQFLDDIACTMPTPDDWCFVYNFRSPNSPTVLNMPAGGAKILKAGMDELVLHLKTDIPKAFESKEYEQSVHALIHENQNLQQEMFNQLSEKARTQGFSLEISKMGVSVVPIIDGNPVGPEQFEALDEATKNDIETRREALQQEINAFLRQVRDINKSSRDRVNELNRRVGMYVVGMKIESLKEQHAQLPRVTAYLDDVQDYILSHLDDFTEDSQKQESSPTAKLSLEPPADPFVKYRVNIVVDNTDVQGAPVVIETNPTYYNIFGRMDRWTQLGTLQTDFTMIQAGAYMKANGGFLVVNAHDVLLNFGVWETLKRTVKNKEVRIEDLSVQYGLVPVAGMRPNPIPTNVKVIMIGNQMIYHLLYEMDEDFRKIFKVKADFDSQMDRSTKSLQSYASFISNRCHHENLLHFDPTGVAEVIEYGARLVDDQEKLSSRFSDVADIVREASFWAAQDRREIVSADHVRRAIEEKYFRSSLVEERLREFITEGTIMVDVTGEAVGQVNGLAVIDLGDIRFGKPSRITAKTFVGKSGVLDIERESKMSGKIYEKGVLILGGYLGASFAQERPLSLSASICFEQSYEGVDGDSASSTELYALLSSLSNAPIRQGIAVTGSVNQHGMIQPIGGVNQKIEGFYDVCKAKGLTGDQGVMIPIQNIKNLMLRPDVVEAVKQGKFHLYAVRSINEGIEILTGLPAGVKVNGCYPEGTINQRVEQRLKDFAEGLKKFTEADSEKEKDAK
ncbi:MAG: AAA family ATPase [Acidobacteriia bacterium]|nr:AAA family ATPase [Terriglobia bacterium]